MTPTKSPTSIIFTNTPTTTITTITIFIIITILTFCTAQNEIIKTVEVGRDVWFDLTPWTIDTVRCLRGSEDIIPSEKYVFEDDGTNYLKIRNVGLQDFGIYKCQRKPDFKEEKLFNLLVVDGIKMTVNPTNIRYPGQTIAVTCRSEINVEYMLRLTEEQQLHFHLDVGPKEKEVIDDNVEIFEKEKRVLEVVFNVTIEEYMNLKNLTCRLTSINPAFTTSQSVWIQLAFGPTEIIFPNQKEFSVGEMVNCTAHAYPEPLVTWQPVHLPSNCKSESEIDSMLTFASLKLACIGYQSWQCVVRYDPDGIDVNNNNWDKKWNNNNPNNLNNLNTNNNLITNTNNNNGSLLSGVTNNPQKKEMLQVFNFTVDESPTEDESKGGIDSKTSLILGLVLGLGIPLLLITILLIACCCCRKNRSKKGTKTTLAKAIDPKKKQKPVPIKTVSASKAVSVNTAPNPAARSPPNVIRGSPGIPDIGAGHLGGSGSIPQLNDSMDGRPQQYSNYSEIAPQQRQPQQQQVNAPVNFGRADLGGNKGFTDI